METIQLGSTGIEVPRVSLGTWGHGGPLEAGRHPVGWSGHDDGDARATLVRAWELGIRHWDTADVYGEGRSERLIGDVWDTVPRDQIFLASKVGWHPGPRGLPYHPDQISARLERSLRNLRVEHIDLYYFHHCDFGPHDRHLEAALEAVHRARSQGKIRFVGLSDWDSRKVARLAPLVDPEVVQPYRNLLDDDYRESGLGAWVDERQAGVAFFSPLKHGLLLGKHRRPPELGRGDHRLRIPAFRDQRLLDHLRRCRDEVDRRFASHPQPLLHALVDGLLTDAPTGCVLVGMRKPGHAEAAATLGVPLSPEEAAWVRGLYRADPA